MLLQASQFPHTHTPFHKVGIEWANLMLLIQSLNLVRLRINNGKKSLE